MLYIKYEMYGFVTFYSTKETQIFVSRNYHFRTMRSNFLIPPYDRYRALVRASREGIMWISHFGNVNGHRFLPFRNIRRKLVRRSWGTQSFAFNGSDPIRYIPSAPSSSLVPLSSIPPFVNLPVILYARFVSWYPLRLNLNLINAFHLILLNNANL